MILKKSQNPCVAILGNGAFGTALASLFVQRHSSILLGRDEALSNFIHKNKENPRYLPQLSLPNTLCASSDIERYLPTARYLFLALPAQKMRKILLQYQSVIGSETILIGCAKGIEQSSGAFMHEILRELFQHNPIALLSGPSFAQEMVQALPTAVTIASNDLALAQTLSKNFSYLNFRCYASDDIKGVALGGALKNIFALASGMCVGKNLGQNANAALITRSFAELRRVGLFFGARLETLSGLSGFGDLFLTCSSPKSRNFSYGLTFARGEKTENILVEGVATTQIVQKMCQMHQIEAPLIEMIDQIISHSLSLDEAIKLLFDRPLKIED